MMTYGFEEQNTVVAKNILKNAEGTTFDVYINLENFIIRLKQFSSEITWF